MTQYVAPWPVAVTCAFSAGGIMLALIPIRRGELWAIWTSLGTLLILLATRISTDPRCLVVLDPHQHGCHSFMISIVLAVLGLAFAGFGRSRS